MPCSGGRLSWAGAEPASALASSDLSPHYQGVECLRSPQIPKLPHPIPGTAACLDNRVPGPFLSLAHPSLLSDLDFGLLPSDRILISYDSTNALVPAAITVGLFPQMELGSDQLRLGRQQLQERSLLPCSGSVLVCACGVPRDHDALTAGSLKASSECLLWTLLIPLPWGPTEGEGRPLSFPTSIRGLPSRLCPTGHTFLTFRADDSLAVCPTLHSAQCLSLRSVFALGLPCREMQNERGTTQGRWRSRGKESHMCSSLSIIATVSNALETARGWVRGVDHSDGPPLTHGAGGGGGVGGGGKPCECCFHRGRVCSLGEEALVSPEFFCPLSVFLCIWRARLPGGAPRGSAPALPRAALRRWVHERTELIALRCLTDPRGAACSWDKESYSYCDMGGSWWQSHSLGGSSKAGEDTLVL
ncbi:hypothetical protein Cadr_000003584 [Camelus dromedarius]|uniref:Uncharacterized protein n=1 Tax=Camelus dromedarius TaxID=9838 RepID=A0A5N4C1X8_CAMDR|nr:hypothetical protein Cadr_000003584 [Camelus dromedarius]